MKKLPWKLDEYKGLEPGDLRPEPAPTPEQRLRVAAAIATLMRDEAMLGKKPSGPSVETIRAILMMSPEEWSHTIRELNPGGFEPLLYDRRAHSGVTRTTTKPNPRITNHGSL